MMNKALFTSKTDEWETPQYFFDKLSTKFDFKLDVCATHENTKCKKYITKENDSLNSNWSIVKGWKWMNPPYGREIKDWVKKASEERNVVALLPARTDTKYFHEYIYKKKDVEIRFIKGRLKFLSEGKVKDAAPFPSMIVIFR